MTREQIEEIVETWQEALGLQNWDLKVDWAKPAHEDADATTWRSNTYDRATMHFDSGFENWTLEFANWIVVHELLHLITRDLDETHKSVEEHLHRSTWALHDQRYDHVIEGVVDRLARRIVLIGGCVGEADDQGAESATEVEVCWTGSLVSDS